MTNVISRACKQKCTRNWLPPPREAATNCALWSPPCECRCRCYFYNVSWYFVFKEVVLECLEYLSSLVFQFDVDWNILSLCYWLVISVSEVGTDNRVRMGWRATPKDWWPMLDAMIIDQWLDDLWWAWKYDLFGVYLLTNNFRTILQIIYQTCKIIAAFSGLLQFCVNLLYRSHT